MTQLNFDARTVAPARVQPDDIQSQRKDTSRVWSKYQQDIFSHIAHGTGNAIVKAVAGSGKSSTIVEGQKYVRGDAILLAFNKSIAEELKTKGVNARTFHSLTYNPVLRAVGAATVDANKVRNLCKAKMKGSHRIYGGMVEKLIGMARQIGVGCLTPDVFDVWMSICIHHDIEPEDGGNIGEGIEQARAMFDFVNADDRVDFDDLLYRAVKDNISLPRFDYVFVDEAQDTNMIQRAIIHKIMRPNARMMAVGDPAQAIYGFRGADSNSMTLIRDEFGCIELPLSISYRCPTSVVTYAQQWMPNIEAAPNAKEGEVVGLGREWDTSIFAPNDLVVCRKTAHLMALAYRLLRDRVPCTVMGKDIGQGLKSLVNKMNVSDLDALVTRLEAYVVHESKKAHERGDDGKVEAIQDKVSAILVLIDSLEENVFTIDGLLDTIDILFADKIGAVLLATIHKSKGLEAKRVFWLARSECPSRWAKQEWQQQQERNLCYVATTRAIDSLFFLEL